MKATQYKELMRQKSAPEETFNVTLPSGFVWKLRKFPLQQYIVAGRLPTFFASQMKSAAQGETKEALTEKFAKEGTEEDILESLEFVRKIINYCAVEPRIALDPQTDDEIAPEEIDAADFEALQNWCLSGGAEHLTPFRPRRQQSVVVSTNGAGKRRKSK